MQNKSFYFRVAVTLVAAFALSAVLMDAVFPTKTPQVRGNLGDYLKEKKNSLNFDIAGLIPRVDLGALLPLGNLSQVAPGKEEPSPTPRAQQGESIIAAGVRQQLATKRPQALSPGMSTVSNADSYLTILRQDKAEWSGNSRTVGGKNINIRTISGQSLPGDQALAEMGL